MLEIFLKMNKCAGCLNQTFEEIVVVRIFVEPKLLQNVVRLVITLLVPTLKIGAVIGMARDLDFPGIEIFAAQLRHESRNPLAFGHEELSLLVALMMSKQAGIIFSRANVPPASGDGTHMASPGVLR
jgi:hypothetical protein